MDSPLAFSRKSLLTKFTLVLIAIGGINLEKMDMRDKMYKVSFWGSASPAKLRCLVGLARRVAATKNGTSYTAVQAMFSEAILFVCLIFSSTLEGTKSLPN